MSFLSMAHMYQVVRDMYDSPKWREKVLHMSDNQIMAIYFSKEERDKARKAERKRTKCRKTVRCCEEVVRTCGGCEGSTDDYIPEQLSFFD